MTDTEIRKRWGHQDKGVKGIRVYYLMGHVVCSGVITKRVGNRVIFVDGGWNPAKDCYLTAGQCRRAHNLDLYNALKRASGVVDRASSALQDVGKNLNDMAVGSIYNPL